MIYLYYYIFHSLAHWYRLKIKNEPISTTSLFSLVTVSFSGEGGKRIEYEIFFRPCDFDCDAVQVDGYLIEATKRCKHCDHFFLVSKG